jgi:hypothetical protein
MGDRAATAGRGYVAPPARIAIAEVAWLMPRSTNFRKCAPGER